MNPRNGCSPSIAGRTREAPSYTSWCHYHFEKSSLSCIRLGDLSWTRRPYGLSLMVQGPWSSQYQHAVNLQQHHNTTIHSDLTSNEPAGTGKAGRIVELFCYHHKPQTMWYMPGCVQPYAPPAFLSRCRSHRKAARYRAYASVMTFCW